MQTPAIGDYGQPCTVKLADIRGFSCKPLFPPDEDYPTPTIALQLHYVEHGTDNVAKISHSQNQTEAVRKRATFERFESRLRVRLETAAR